MPRRIRQFLLIAGLVWSSWLCMMLVHEAGHVIGALLTGGHIKQVVWHPFVFSRTDVEPNPSPIIEVWAGPMIGCVIPFGLSLSIKLTRWRLKYMLSFFASFCLIANGLYIGIGSIDPIGDTRQLVHLGVSRITILTFGIVASSIGFWILNAISPQLGFGHERVIPLKTDVNVSLCAAASITLICFAFGNRGF
jgi:hypothetical protein